MRRCNPLYFFSCTKTAFDISQTRKRRRINLGWYEFASNFVASSVLSVPMAHSRGISGAFLSSSKFSRWGLIILPGHGHQGRINILLDYTRRQNCWGIVHKEGNLREQKNPHPSLLPSIQRWGVCCFLKVAGQWHNIAWRGWGRKSLIFPFWSQ